MKATIHTRYGSPDVLELTEVKKPQPGAHDLLIKVHASPVTQGDRRLRAADFPGIASVFGRLMTGLRRPKHPIPGTMFAGQIVAVGAAVTRFAVGDDVFGSSLNGGAQAEYLAVPEDSALSRMPSNLDYDEAAAVPYGAVTALIFLRDLGELQRGQRALIVGASGGVGQFAVQLAHHLGAEVTGVCSRDHDLVRDLGADHVIDYKTEDFTENGQRYDVIFDTSGMFRFDQCRGSLTPGGRYLSLYVTLRLLLHMATTALFGGPRARTGVALGNRETMDQVRELVEQRALRPVIDSRYPLEHIAEAHARLETGRTSGNVVVLVVSPRARPAVQQSGDDGLCLGVRHVTGDKRASGRRSYGRNA